MSGSQDESFLFSNCMRDNAVTDDMGLLHDLNSTSDGQICTATYFCQDSLSKSSFTQYSNWVETVCRNFMFIIFSISLCLFFTQMPWNTTICISLSQRNIYKLLWIAYTILLVTKTKDISQQQLWQCNMLPNKNIYTENIMCDILCLYYKLSQSPWTYEPKRHPETTACTLTCAVLCF